MMRIMWEEKKFRKVSKVKILEFEGNRPVIKNNWTALKKLFRREKQNLQEIKIQIQSPRFLQKRDLKIENLDKKFCQ